VRLTGTVIAALAMYLATFVPLQANAQGSPVQPMPVTPPPGAARLPLGTPLVITKQARFRTEPHPSADIISLLPAGTPVALAGPWGASWVQIRYQNRVGFVLRSLVRPTQ